MLHSLKTVCIYFSFNISICSPFWKGLTCTALYFFLLWLICYVITVPNNWDFTFTNFIKGCSIPTFSGSVKFTSHSLITSFNASFSGLKSQGHAKFQIQSFDILLHIPYTPNRYLHTNNPTFGSFADFSMVQLHRIVKS